MDNSRIKTFSECEVMQNNFKNLNPKDKVKVLDLIDMLENCNSTLEFSMKMTKMIYDDVLEYTKKLDIAIDECEVEYDMCISIVLLKYFPYWTKDKVFKVVQRMGMHLNLDTAPMYFDLVEIKKAIEDGTLRNK